MRRPDERELFVASRDLRTEAPEWKDDLQKNVWADAFISGDAFRKELDQDYAEMKSVLSDIGLAK